jgi:cobalt transporter subunit CbtB
MPVAQFPLIAEIPHAADARPRDRAVVLTSALATVAIGLLLLFGVGFVQNSAVHNGAHDTRHANGFPCH